MPDESGVTLQIILDEVRSARSDVNNLYEEVRDVRTDVRENRGAIDGLRSDMHGQIGHVHTKINRNSEAIVGLSAKDNERTSAWKKWTAILGTIVAVIGLAYTLHTAIVG
jgi:hypothetical protein